MIKVVNLSKDYGDGPILENVSFEVNEGEAVVIIGGSGCGKSTLLRCINRLIVPEKGEIYINDQNILDPSADIDQIRSKMGMVYQQFNLFSHLNILDNITLAPIKVAHRSKEEAEAEARKLLERVGLSGKEYVMPSSLSGGQKQRVAIARTLAMHPEVILFDEPTSALDPTMVDEVESVIRSLVDEGMTSIIVTHEMRFAKNIASRVLFLAEKGIYEQGTPEEVFDHPKKVLTQRFIYRARMFEKQLVKNDLDLPGLVSETKQFLRRYQYDSRQLNFLRILCDELLYPIFRSEPGPENADFKVFASESGTDHVIHIRFRGISSDPLKEPYVDELNRALLEHYTKFILSRQVHDGYQITIQM